VGDKLKTKADSENILLRLVKGRYGLPVTFWIWGAGGIFLLATFMNAVFSVAGSDTFVFVCIFVFIAYVSVVLIGVWMAVDVGKGVGTWGILAKIFVIFSFALLTFVSFYFFSMVTSDYPNH
jgi:hypothetical protein